MCKIVLIINKKPENKKAINNFLTANYYNLISEQSGYSILRDRKVAYYCGDRAYLNFDKNIIYRNEEIYILHSRTKTAGEEGIDGLHLQAIDSYLFAHNGTITDFSTVTKKSDSYYFFKHYLKSYPIPTPKSFEIFAKKKSFSGKGILYNPKTKKLYYFCDEESNIYVLPDCLIITSFTADIIKTIYKEKCVLGFRWYERKGEEPIKEIIKNEEINNIFYEFTNGVLKTITPIDLTGFECNQQDRDEYIKTLKEDYKMTDEQIAEYYKDEEEKEEVTENFKKQLLIYK